MESIAEGQAELEDIDVADDNQIDSTQKAKKELDVEDEAVKDRWSRYIGAMGVEAVAKQGKFDVCISHNIGVALVLLLTFDCTSFILKAWLVEVHVF